jgi:hypothetical protein
MAKLVDMKECIKCTKKMYNVDIATRYCPECKNELKLERGRKQSKNRTQKKDTKNKLDENMNKIKLNGYQLTPIGFNTVSSISSFSYSNYYKIPWIKIMKLYNLDEKLLDYIIDEYEKYMKLTCSQDIKRFSEQHEYLSPRFLKTIGFDYLRELANVKKMRNNEDDYKNNFFLIHNTLGRIPLFNEFVEMSRITPTTYANHLNLKGKIYDNIVKYYVSENEYNEYLKMKNEHKSKVGTETGKLSATYSDEDYEKEFKRVIEYCLSEFGELPSQRIFNELSKIDLSSFRRRFNRSWIEICEKYGYEIDRTANKSEKIVLANVKSIISENYIPQQTFDWLRGVNDFVLFCDGYYPNHNLVIEFDGRQHIEPVKSFGGEKTFRIQQANDQIKNNLIPKHGLKLVRISCYEPFWNKEYIKKKLIEYKVI